MKKKILTWMLAAALSASVLVGCGNTEETADNGNVVSGEADTDETNAADAESEAQDVDEEEDSNTENAEQDTVMNPDCIRWMSEYILEMVICALP